MLARIINNKLTFIIIVLQVYEYLCMYIQNVSSQKLFPIARHKLEIKELSKV